MVNGIGNSSSRKSVDQINKIQNQLSDTFDSISSGKKSRKKDAAGFAIADAALVEVAALDKAQDNVSYGNSAISIADGALGQISELETRRAELATQSANGTLSDDQRATLNQEYQALGEEITRITQTTEFNGTNVLESDMDLQVGPDGSTGSRIKIPASPSLSAPSGDILSAANAQAALDSSTQRISLIAQSRGSLGAAESRLASASESISSRSVELKKSASQITDADIGEETSNLNRLKIQQKAASSVLKQGNSDAKNILKLLA